MTSQWADFAVSAIKKGSGLANISHVQIHEDLENGFGPPELIDKYKLSSQIQIGISFITIQSCMIILNLNCFIKIF